MVSGVASSPTASSMDILTSGNLQVVINHMTAHYSLKGRTLHTGERSGDSGATFLAELTNLSLPVFLCNSMDNEISCMR